MTGNFSLFTKFYFQKESLKLLLKSCIRAIIKSFSFYSKSENLKISKRKTNKQKLRNKKLTFRNKITVDSE